MLMLQPSFMLFICQDTLLTLMLYVQLVRGRILPAGQGLHFARDTEAHYAAGADWAQQQGE